MPLSESPSLQKMVLGSSSSIGSSGRKPDRLSTNHSVSKSSGATKQCTVTSDGAAEMSLEQQVELGIISPAEYHRRCIDATRGDVIDSRKAEHIGLQHRTPSLGGRGFVAKKEQAPNNISRYSGSNHARGEVIQLLGQGREEQNQHSAPGILPEIHREPPVSMKWAGPALAAFPVSRHGQTGIVVTNVGVRPTPQQGRSWMRDRPVT